MLIVREGETSVGLHFVACHAKYLARGWIKSLRMVEGGPQEFSLFINNTECARTTNGEITIANFAPGAIEDLQNKTLPHDKFLLTGLQKDQGYFNLTFPGSITIVTSEPPSRQNYFMIQTWAQLFQAKKDSHTGTDMDLEEVPCLLAYNLRSEDTTAIINKTWTITTAEDGSSGGA